MEFLSKKKTNPINMSFIITLCFKFRYYTFCIAVCPHNDIRKKNAVIPELMFKR